MSNKIYVTLLLVMQLPEILSSFVGKKYAFLVSGKKVFLWLAYINQAKRNIDYQKFLSFFFCTISLPFPCFPSEANHR